MTVNLDGHTTTICGLREKMLRMKARGEELKILKPGVLKQTNTIRFGWTRDNDLWTSRENALDESERGAKTPEV
jgi:hypothetical protein